MKCPRRPAAWLIACGVAWMLTAPTLAARQTGTAEPEIPTPIEEALIEHACGAMRPANAPETAPYLECRSTQLLSLRNEFGRDLRRLSNAERRAIDSACTELRMSRGQDAYVECLTARLNGLRGRGSRAKPEAGSAVAVPAPIEAPPAVAPPPPSPPSSGGSGLWIGATLVGLTLAGAGGAFMAMRSRRSFGACRSCGVKLPERGNLCQKCRHEAADALRRAAADRAEQARAQEDEQRRLAEREEEQRQQQARDEEERLRQIDETAREQARQQEQAQQRRDEEARQRRQTDAAATEGEFDPHVVLGVTHGATAAEVEAAYKAARLRYDMELVADLGAELQEHFKRKAEAVERAYQILAPPQPL